ncbi:Hpt domain-containing protein [Noviherbaspirillum aridicola]|uniref:HPt domain-containing protein n=1 Tax=Noviherbaspirillum aridicola TaxID=2849687 RepID=A0ABQ4Q6Y1_9BURK|nr:Hpt domain-containing protein [Noviherbaspirillum aridicola]GIZ52802.1 hypothetical protein NCCP691_28160 [Noviherbaspirillum aridicola]
MTRYSHIDPEVLLDMIERDPDDFAQLSQTFLRIAPPGMQRLEAAAGAGDAGAVRHESHALKGSLMLVGASACAGQANELERAAMEARAEDFPALLPALRTEFAAVLAEVAASIVEFGPKGPA